MIYTLNKWGPVKVRAAARLFSPLKNDMQLKMVNLLKQILFHPFFPLKIT